MRTKSIRHIRFFRFLLSIAIVVLGVEQASAQMRGLITINDQATPALRLDKGVFGPGEEIRVSFSAPGHFARDAWVGIIPSRVSHGSEAENDKYDITYQYLEKRTSGVLVFQAPNEEGRWDLRMHDTDGNGREVASVSFTVSGHEAVGSSISEVPDGEAKPFLKLERSVFGPGEEIRVSFSAPGHFARDAWVGIIPSRVSHGSEAENDKYDITYQYLEKRTSGVLVFQAPKEEGRWDLRMHDTDGNGREVASVSFTVSGF